MTRRLTIVLDDSVTESSCGECRFLEFDRCTNFVADLEIDTDGDSDYDRLRLPECLEAERAAARMVEIDPALVAEAAIDCIVPNTISADAQEAASKIESILREHAQKAAR